MVLCDGRIAKCRTQKSPSIEMLHDVQYMKGNVQLVFYFFSASFFSERVFCGIECEVQSVIYPKGRAVCVISSVYVPKKK